MAELSEINFFGLTSFRSEQKKFGIKTDDRRRHFYCIGKTGMGKSNLMENMAIQDIQAGRGIAYVDPHGEGAEKLLDFVPSRRINDVIFFNPSDLDFPIAFNVMEKVDFKFRHLVAGGLMGVFKKVWPDVWSARMEYILNNTILALLEYPDSTLLGVNRMLADPDYREKVVAKVTDPIVKSFWTVEFAKYSQRYEQEATAAIQNKVGQFVSNALIRNIIGQTRSTINMRDIMDNKKIFIMDLSKGRIGEDNSRLLGALLITKLQLAAMSRVDIPEPDRKDFYLYVDEFQNFATESFANILSEARKYRLNLILGHQYIAQMTEEVRDAVFGNVGTLTVFRVGAEDAEFLEKEFSPEFTAEDLVNLPKYNIYLKLMIDGVSGHPFSAQTLPPPPALEESNRDKIINASRERYSVKKDLVEEKIARWTGIDEESLKAQETAKPMAKKPGQPMQFGDQQPALYDAICSSCGKATKVIFQPEPGRKVYCKACLKKMKAAEEQHQEQHIEQKEKVAEVKPQELKEVKQEISQEVKQETREPERHNFKIESVPFHTPKKRSEPEKAKPKRKEINLSELRKALEESLQLKEKDNEPEEEPEEKEDLPMKVEKQETHIIPAEKREEDKKDNTSKKGVIKPGETVKF